MALRFLLRFPAFSQKEQNGPFFTFPWRFQTFLTALHRALRRMAGLVFVFLVLAGACYMVQRAWVQSPLFFCGVCNEASKSAQNTPGLQ